MYEHDAAFFMLLFGIPILLLIYCYRRATGKPEPAFRVNLLTAVGVFAAVYACHYAGLVR
jgi:hypothetical protein